MMRSCDDGAHDCFAFAASRPPAQRARAVKADPRHGGQGGHESIVWHVRGPASRVLNRGPGPGFQPPLRSFSTSPSALLANSGRASSILHGLTYISAFRRLQTFLD